MLILTRRVAESIVVGDDIKVTILGTKGSNVRIGIEAPKSLSVHREEVYTKVLNERIRKLIEAKEGEEVKEDGGV